MHATAQLDVISGCSVCIVYSAVDIYSIQELIVVNKEDGYPTIGSKG